MRLRRRAQDTVRREPRPEAFKSTDLNKRLRTQLDPWFEQDGFRHLGARAWTRQHGNDHLIVAVQCRQSGWDRFSGSEFVVEFELSATPQPATGFHRDRIWRLLSEADKQEALRIADSVALTLPAPSDAFVSALPPTLRDRYLQRFAPADKSRPSQPMWFHYYDEHDADQWAVFLRNTLAEALRTFLAQPPSFFGHRPA